MLTVLIGYIDLLYKIVFVEQGYIVCASDTYKSENLQAMHENCGINIRELVNLSKPIKQFEWLFLISPVLLERPISQVSIYVGFNCNKLSGS